MRRKTLIQEFGRAIGKIEANELTLGEAITVMELAVADSERQCFIWAIFTGLMAFWTVVVPLCAMASEVTANGIFLVLPFGYVVARYARRLDTWRKYRVRCTYLLDEMRHYRVMQEFSHRGI